MPRASHPPFILLAAIPGGREDIERASMSHASPAPSSGAPQDDEGQRQARLLAALAQGDRHALGDLYDALAQPLFSLAFRITRDAAESQDVVQDVFVKLLHQAATFRPERGSVFTWAAALTRNRAIDRVRSRRRHGELLAGAAEQLQPASGPADQDTAGALWLREKAAAVRVALGRLAPEQQQALELAYFSGLTQQEIAAQLNEPLGTIKARIRRGLLRLRESLPTRL